MGSRPTLETADAACGRVVREGSTPDEKRLASSSHAGGHVVYEDTVADALACYADAAIANMPILQGFPSERPDTVLPICCPK
jgi:hypothetical protein